MKELAELSKIIKQLRLQNKYTQTYVANKIGISCSSYQAYEWGVNIPSLPSFIKLADLYDIPLDELIGRKVY